MWRINIFKNSEWETDMSNILHALKDNIFDKLKI